MKKTIFAIIMIVAVLSSIITVFGMNAYNAHRKDIKNLTDEVVYHVTAKQVHEEALQKMDAEAYASNYTGVAAVSANVGADTLTWNACYINGERVEADEFDEWIYDVTEGYCNDLDTAYETIEEQTDRLNNITLADYLECVFN